MPDKIKIIDCETLEIFESMTHAAKILKVSPQRVHYSILYNERVGGRKLEHYDYWVELHDQDKEAYTYRNNIFFLKGKQTCRVEEPLLIVKR